MNSDRSIAKPLSTDAPREDWLRAGILAGFLGTFAMTIVLVAAYGLASSIGGAKAMSSSAGAGRSSTTPSRSAPRMASCWPSGRTWPWASCSPWFMPATSNRG